MFMTISWKSAYLHRYINKNAFFKFDYDKPWKNDIDANQFLSSFNSNLKGTVDV